jgi:hypothetical protein
MPSTAAPARERSVRGVFASSRIEPPLADKLSKYAAKAKITRSSAIRLALIEFLESQTKK